MGLGWGGVVVRNETNIRLSHKIKSAFTFIPKNTMHLEYGKYIQRICGNVIMGENGGEAVVGRDRRKD